MPKINLRDPDSGPGGNLPDDPHDEMSPPPLPGDPEESGAPKWLIIGGAILLLGVVVVALNQFKVIHLWGKKVPKVVETLPEPTLPPVDSIALAAQQQTTLSTPETTPLPTDTKPAAGKAKGGKTGTTKEAKVKPSQSVPAQTARPAVQASGGAFAIQMSSWPTRRGADKAAQSLTAAGVATSVIEADVSGKTWYRVRAGSYTSMADAKKGLDDLRAKGITEGIVVKDGK